MTLKMIQTPRNNQYLRPSSNAPVAVSIKHQHVSPYFIRGEWSVRHVGTRTETPETQTSASNSRRRAGSKEKVVQIIPGKCTSPVAHLAPRWVCVRMDSVDWTRESSALGMRDHCEIIHILESRGSSDRDLCIGRYSRAG